MHISKFFENKMLKYFEDAYSKIPENKILNLFEYTYLNAQSIFEFSSRASKKAWYGVLRNCPLLFKNCWPILN